MKRFVPILLISALAAQLNAEVAVVRNGAHRFMWLRTAPRMPGATALFWQHVDGDPDDDYLNVEGDAQGDHPPAWVVLPKGELQDDPSPLVAWPRESGGHLDIYFSIWSTASGWSVPARLSVPNFRDDAGVRLFPDRNGDVHATWWTNDDIPSVWYAKFSRGNWSAPRRMSNPMMDSRNPAFAYTPDRILILRWEVWTVKPARSESFLLERFDP